MLKLLIVDDEVDIREFAKRFFSKRSINVFTADGGRGALSIVETEKPDLILLDVNMGDMDGIETLKILREKGDQTKVMMVTGVEDEAIVNELKDLGIAGIVHKPLILEELEQIVMKELNG